MKKVACKGCNRPILEKTAKKYKGMSLQCLKKDQMKKYQSVIESNNKILAEIKKEKKIVPKIDTMTNEDILLEITNLEYYLAKTVITFPKIYSKKEFSSLYAIKDKDLQKKYYENYLGPINSFLDTIDSDWLPTKVLNHYEFIA